VPVTGSLLQFQGQGIAIAHTNEARLVVAAYFPGSAVSEGATSEVSEHMIGVYSNRLGCLGSIVVSILATLLLVLLLRGCGLSTW